MKTPQLLVLLLTILVHIAAGFPSERRGREKSASWDDVNVVAHGLLQLGQGLKEHVDKTKAGMRDVNAKLKAFNGTLGELQRRQQEQREQQEALTGRLQEVQESQTRTAQLAQEATAKAEEARKQTEELHSRMEKLEEVLREPTVEGNEHTGVSFIQKLVAAQNRRIDQLVEKIKQQQDKLEKQSLHLQVLQSKVAHKKVKSHGRRDEETARQVVTEAGSAQNCHDLFVRGQKVSGVYAIQPENSRPFNVFCEMTSEGGWTVIQRRHDGSQNFNQLWDEYKNGFGSLNGEFWLGLDNIHSLSKQGHTVLQVALSDQSERQQEFRYRFRLDGEEQKFALHLERETPSGLREEVAAGVPFSTADRDNDAAADVNCAETLSGGWWFSSCGESNLNGKYPRRPNVRRRQAMFWRGTQGPSRPLKTTILKIAPTQ